MPTVRVFLESLAQAGQPSGSFDTFVSLTEDELAAGNHLRAAMRRAAIRGFEAPYRVIEVRQLGFARLTDGHARLRRGGRRADGVLQTEPLPEPGRVAA